MRLWAEYQTLAPMTKLKPEGLGHGSERNDNATDRQFAGWWLVEKYLRTARYGSAMRTLIAHVASGEDVREFRLMRRVPTPSGTNDVIYIDKPVDWPRELRELLPGSHFETSYRLCLKGLARHIETKNLTIEPEFKTEVSA